MGKKLYRVISIAVLGIISSIIILKSDTEVNSYDLSEKTIEVMNDQNDKNNENKEETQEQITKETTWNLTSLYKDKASWKKELKKFSKDIKELENYVGKVTQSDKHLSYALKIQEDLDKRVESLYAYVSLNRDINKKSYEFIDMREELNKVYREYQPICSNLELEILKLSDSKFNEMMKNKNISTKYGMYLKDIRRNKKYYFFLFVYNCSVTEAFYCMNHFYNFITE